MNIKDLRERAGLSQAELAAMLGMLPTNFGRLEKKRREPTILQERALTMAAYIAASGQLEKYLDYAREVARRG